MKLVSIREESPAVEAGMQPGDELVSINGNPVADHIDFLFHASDVDLELEVERGGSRLRFSVTCDMPADLGLQFEEQGPRTCGDDCIFCFVDQNPPGVRSPSR